MDKQILEQYIDACELVRGGQGGAPEVEEAPKQIQQDIVKGSSPEFPYTALHTYHLQGISICSCLKIPDECRTFRRRFYSSAWRSGRNARLSSQVEAWMLTISPRMQRIIRYRIFEELTWAQVAVRMGRKATADSVRMEFQISCLSA